MDVRVIILEKVKRLTIGEKGVPKTVWFSPYAHNEKPAL